MALAVVVVLLAGACGAGTAEPSAGPSTPAEASATATPTPSPEATADPAPTPEETAEAAAVVLDAAGVGGVPMGTPDPRAALEALLGPAEAEWADLECGPGDVDALQWGALSVTTLEGALWGWDVSPRRGALPGDVVVASGVTPVQPFADAMALPGATAPQYLENLDLLVVQADGVSYYGSGSDAATATVELVGVNVVVCG